MTVAHIDELFIANAATEFDAGYAEVTNPATGEILRKVRLTPLDLADSIVTDAERGFTDWNRHSTRERSRMLYRASQLLIERQDEVAKAITLEMGKPLAEAKAETQMSADYLLWYAEETVRTSGRYAPAPNGNGQLVTMKAPLGVAYLISPWNFPLMIVVRKAAAALAAGCSIIMQQSILTPTAATHFLQILWEAGVPKNVAQLIATDAPAEWSQTLMADERVRKVSFTGSTRVGQILIRQSAEHLQKLSLELGGDAPFIVCADANLEQAVEAAVLAKTRNGGQACVAANRFLVAEAVSADFNAALARALANLQVGPGIEPGSQIGPLISAAAKEQTMQLVSEATALGGTLHGADAGVDLSGQFIRPSVLVDVPRHSKIAQSEIFAPIAVVETFTEISDAISRANDSSFGLSSYVFSQNLDTAFGIAERLRTGMVGINKGVVADPSGPFGGTAYSGYGREGGSEGLDDFQYVRQFNIENSGWKF